MVVDSKGTELIEGDDVELIKDVTIQGSILPKGTIFKNIYYYFNEGAVDVGRVVIGGTEVDLVVKTNLLVKI